LAPARAEQILLVMAKMDGRYVGGALNFFDDTTLYGRNWDAPGTCRSLHFEACYNQAIDFAIERKLQRVEAGAQGGHKLLRG
jgi:predicted N-acyltransferase